MRRPSFQKLSFEASESRGERVHIVSCRYRDDERARGESKGTRKKGYRLERDGTGRAPRRTHARAQSASASDSPPLTPSTLIERTDTRTSRPPSAWISLAMSTAKLFSFVWSLASFERSPFGPRTVTR